MISLSKRLVFEQREGATLAETVASMKTFIAQNTRTDGFVQLIVPQLLLSVLASAGRNPNGTETVEKSTINFADGQRRQYVVSETRTEPYCVTTHHGFECKETVFDFTVLRDKLTGFLGSTEQQETSIEQLGRAGVDTSIVDYSLDGVVYEMPEDKVEVLPTVNIVSKPKKEPEQGKTAEKDRRVRRVPKQEPED